MGDRLRLAVGVMGYAASSLLSTAPMTAKSFKYLIPMLIACLQVSGRDKDGSPFTTHPVKMWVSVVATIIYCHAYHVSVTVAFVSGSLSTISLVSIFLPGLLGLLIFIPWAFLLLIVTYQLLAVFIHNASHGLMEFTISKFSVLWTWFTRSNSVVQEQPRVSV